MAMEAVDPSFSAAGLDSVSDAELSWVTRISRTRVSTVDGLNLTDSVHHGMVQSLEGILQAVQKLKIKRVQFDEIDEIRQVGHGETFRVVESRLKNEVVAIKHIKLEHVAASSSEHYFHRRLQSVTKEVLIMHHTPLASHPNILNLLGYGWQVDEGRPAPYILVDYGDLGSLRQFLTWSDQSLRAKMVLGGDVACGLMALHACGIVHGDVKLDNVVMFSSPDRPICGKAKICDFGHSILLSDTDRKNLHYYGTALYNAPEVTSQSSKPIASQDLHKCDIWAFGLLIWEILLDGMRYFRKEWRHDAKLLRSLELISPHSLEQNLSGSRTTEPILDTEDVDDDTVFGRFDPVHLRTLAKDYLKSINAKNAEFEKGYLRALFEQALQPDPNLRLSDLNRSPLISRYYNKVASSTALQANMAIHTGNAGFTYDLFLRERSQYIAWAHETQILQDLETTCTSSQNPTSLPAALFHAALCFINAFGTSRNDIKACQYLQKAQERGHLLARLVWQRISNVISTIPVKEDLPYRKFLQCTALEGRRCVRSCRVRFVSPTAPAVATECCNYEDFVTAIKGQEHRTEIKVSVESEGSTLALNLLETAIAFEDHVLVADICNDFDLSRRGAWNETPLQQAARFGNMELLEALLKENSSWTVDRHLEVLHWLFCFPDASDIKHFLRSFWITKADLNAPRASSTAIHAQWPLKLEGSPLAVAVMVGDERVVAALLEHGADPLAPAFARGVNGDVWTPLHLAVRNHQAGILNLMKKKLPTHGGTGLLDSLPLSCTLSYATAVERMVIHGTHFEAALHGTITSISSTLRAQSAQGRTALLQAIDFEDFQVVDALLRHQLSLASTLLRDPDNEASWIYPLHFAAQNGSQRDTSAAVSIIQRLLVAEPGVLDLRSSDGSTALHLACSGAFTGVLQYLLDQGAKLDIFDHKGQTALHKCRNITSLKMLVNRGINPNLFSAMSGSALHAVAARALIEQARELIAHGASVQAHCQLHGSVLHAAVRSGSREMVQLVLDACPRIDSYDSQQRSPLVLAIELQHMDIAILLLEAGADCFAIRDGRTVLQLTLMSGVPLLVRKMLDLSPIESLRSHWSGIIRETAVECSVSTLRLLLATVKSRNILPRLDIDVTQNRQTPLHRAAFRSRADNVAILLEYGAGVNKLDGEGNTPLLLACASDRHIVFGSSSSSTCLALLSKGALTTIRNFKGQSCLLLAQQRGDFELMTVLLRTALNTFSNIHAPDVADAKKIDGLTKHAEPLEPFFRAAFTQREWDFIIVCVAHRLVPAEVVGQLFKFHKSGPHNVLSYSVGSQMLALSSYARQGDRSMVEYVASLTYDETAYLRSIRTMHRRGAEWYDSITHSKFADKPKPLTPVEDQRYEARQDESLDRDRR